MGSPPARGPGRRPERSEGRRLGERVGRSLVTGVGSLKQGRAERFDAILDELARRENIVGRVY